MEPRKIFSLLREHTLTALIVIGLFALVPMGIPALRSELISAIHPNATIAHIDGEPDDLAEDASEPVDPASPPAPGDKPGLFKRLITSPARLMTKPRSCIVAMMVRSVFSRSVVAKARVW